MAATAGRRVLAMVRDAGACHAVVSRLDRDLGPGLRLLVEVRSGRPGVLLEAACPEAGQAALAIAGPPSTPRAAVLLYAACERVLRPGGILAVLTSSTPGPAGLRDGPGEVIVAARASGFTYTQHIVALLAPITDGRITPAPGLHIPADGAALHTQVHSDLLVFTKPGGSPP
jgi:hypothetical protein